MRRALPALLALLCACRTVPGTGRSQLNMVSESTLIEEASVAFAAMPRANDPAGLARVRAIALRIVSAARGAPGKYADTSLPPPESWEIAIIRDDTPNAFAMPGGKIGFNSGMFRLAKTDADIAVILGHEVAHVVARHGNERVSEGLIASLGAVAVDEATKGRSEEKRSQILSLYGAAVTLGALLPYSRFHESEADRLGLVYMARAGYPPAAAIAFWQRFAKEPGLRPPEFLSTHPSDETRIEEMRRRVPAAEKFLPAQPAVAR